MNKLPLLILASALPVMTGARAETVIFTDTFGSSTLNGTSTPGGTPEASSTSYDVATTKNGTACTIGADRLLMKLTSGTTAGYIELQAIFSSTPVQLVDVGDKLNVTFTFTNSAGTLLTGGNGAVINVGLYNSGGNLPLAGSLNNAGLGSATTFITGNCQNWQGYVGQINTAGSLSSIFTRPIQDGANPNNGVQDLLFSGAGTGLFKFPNGTTIGSTMISEAALISGATYTRSFTIELSAADEVTITDELYAGDQAAGIPLSSMVRTTSGGNTYVNSSNEYDGLAIGISNKGTSANPTMDISKITIIKYTKADEPALYSLQLNGFTDATMSGAAQIGSAGDVWNNPDWVGVYSGSTNLFLDVALLDSTGTDNGVTVSMTSKFNNNTADWNESGHTFNHYSGQTAGSATSILMDREAKIDSDSTLGVNVMTLTFSGLPPDELVTAYVYGAGNGSGQGGQWSLNGSAPLIIAYDGSASGRNVTLASSKGISWQSLSGTIDGAGKLTVTATGPSGGNPWWQTYMNGLQLQIGGTAPVIFGLTNQTVEAGSTVILSPLVTGNPVPTYQWQENGVDLMNETNATLTLPDVTTAQNTYVYSLVANNPIGTVTNSMTLTVNEAVYSDMSVTAVSPDNNATGICYDTPITVTFSDSVTLGTVGSIKIFNATNSETPVDIIDAASGLIQQRTFPGDNQSFSYETIGINGNQVQIHPHFNKLTANQTYYVTIDPKTFKDSEGVNFIGLTDTNAWRFSTKSGPADPTNPTVNADGSADFLTVQGAVNSIPSANTTPTVIHISAGDYNEIVNISGKHNVTFEGESGGGVILGYANNSNFQSANGGTTHARMAFKVNANDIVLKSLNLINRTPQGGSQAEALMIESGAQRCIVLDCQLASRQDTILANINTSQAYFSHSKIVGNFDYIWGGGNLYFDNCEIHTIAGASGFNVTAARTSTSATESASTPWVNPNGTTYSGNGFSFVNCTFTADDGLSGITLAGNNGTAGGLSSWAFCRFSSAYITPTTTLSNTYVFWQYGNTALDGVTPVSFGNVQTIGLTNDDPRLLAATNVTTWFYGWAPQLAATITSQPADQTVTAGQDASFTVAASGAPDVAYQWLQDGTNAPYASANSATLLIPNAQATDATTYAVIVSNAGGSVTSSVVSLTVIIPESPVLDGGSLQVMSDSNLQFSFSGTENAAYRIWATTDLSLTPVTSTWTLVGSGIFGAAPVPFTDVNSTNFTQRFYLITSP
ncbi:MAG TPA: pectinesterase family protein [Verrucomicrobiae bacterium]|nr:pectinesterase family protein [Verrucomicrobiae bacterium]